MLIRDVLHHLPDPRSALAEAVRVLAPGGDLVLVEPNARNPLIRLQMLLVAAERGAARSDPAWIADLLRGLPLEEPRFEMAAAFPLERVVLHHRFGVPGLGAQRAIRRLFAAWDAVTERLVPRSRWSYVVVRARRRENPPPVQSGT